MNRIMYCMASLCLITASLCRAQDVSFRKVNYTDSASLAHLLPVLANKILPKYKPLTDKKAWLSNLVKLQILAGKYNDAINSIDQLRSISKSDNTLYPSLYYVQFELYAKAKVEQQKSGKDLRGIFGGLLNQLLNRLDDKSALSISTAFITLNGVEELKNEFKKSLETTAQKDSIKLDDAVNLCASYIRGQVYEDIEPVSKPLLKQDDNRRYIIQDSVLIKTKDGATLSAVVVHRKGINTPQTSTLIFSIYANLDYSLTEAKFAAAHGYAGIVADARGKRLSPGPIAPYEHENTDVNAVIDWIARQPWSNGKVGMYGGSYLGFSQWAATKHMNKALKTIVPYVAAIPGQGLPMENNIFLNVNYQWAFYVTNNKYLDNAVNNDDQRFRKMNNKWYESGVAYRKIDSVDGTPNPWLQKWIKHPSYDKYWQDMVPYKEDFAKINIPVLTITGYYDDGQISAMQYLREHYKYNPKANHYLIIGPYDHFGAQKGGVAVLRDYTVDPVALIHTKEVTFEWFDYIFKNGQKPALLKDKINYEVMGANTWKHAPSIAGMSNKTLKLYLTNVKADSNYVLTDKKQLKQGSVYQEVDLADRQTANNDYYPYPIIKPSLNRSNGIFYISKPFDKSVQINGIFSGELKSVINKKDMDIGLTFYEVMPNGKYFELSYFLGRASYAKDMSQRHLLHPGVVETIPFSRLRMTSRQLSKGSRLLVVLNIDKNPFAQINYGTGKNVSDETIRDAKEPLKIEWQNDSFINVPLWE